jgi:hypothetical protein
MKSAWSIILFASIPIILSCKTNNRNSIIGKWEYISSHSLLTSWHNPTIIISKDDSIYTHGNSFILEINADSTYNTKSSAGENIPSKSGKYFIIGTQKALMGEDTCNYIFNGDTLTLSCSKIQGEADMEESLKLIRQ